MTEFQIKFLTVLNFTCDENGYFKYGSQSFTGFNKKWPCSDYELSGAVQMFLDKRSKNILRKKLKEQAANFFSSFLG